MDLENLSSIFKACQKIYRISTLIILYDQLKGFRLVLDIIFNVSHNYGFDCIISKMLYLVTQFFLIFLELTSKFSIRVYDSKLPLRIQQVLTPLSLLVYLMNILFDQFRSDIVLYLNFWAFNLLNGK